jgi:hypothetical protein
MVQRLREKGLNLARRRLVDLVHIEYQRKIEVRMGVREQRVPEFNPGQSLLHAFPPMAFAMLIATGIVSIAAHLHSYDTVG